jgi:hypothetical protein
MVVIVTYCSQEEFVTGGELQMDVPPAPRETALFVA